MKKLAMPKNPPATRGHQSDTLGQEVQANQKEGNHKKRSSVHGENESLFRWNWLSIVLLLNLLVPRILDEDLEKCTHKSTHEEAQEAQTNLDWIAAVQLSKDDWICIKELLVRRAFYPSIAYQIEAAIHERHVYRHGREHGFVLRGSASVSVHGNIQ